MPLAEQTFSSANEVSCRELKVKTQWPTYFKISHLITFCILKVGYYTRGINIELGIDTKKKTQKE